VPAGELHARLRRLDPAMARRLQPGDRQRVLRALEVATATGRSLADWQTAPPRRVDLPAASVGVALVPPSAVVNPRIEARLDAMLAAGAVDEVRGLLRRRPDALRLPIAKVHGLRELAVVGEGRLGLAEARAVVAGQIRRYAKRQRTWFRHRLPELRPIVVPGEDPAALRVVADLLRA
jgi:tRNA dimethylallyltransferase